MVRTCKHTSYSQNTEHPFYLFETILFGVIRISQRFFGLVGFGQIVDNSIVLFLLKLRLTLLCKQNCTHVVLITF